jgi:hypothetical protein
MQVIRGNRRRLMSDLKQAELKNREEAVDEIRSFVGDMSNPDRAEVVLTNARRAGIM